jgi:hypothetical protein
VIKEEAKCVIKEEAKCAISASQPALCYYRFSTSALLPALCYQRFSTSALLPALCYQRFSTSASLPALYYQRFSNSAFPHQCRPKETRKNKRRRLETHIPNWKVSLPVPTGTGTLSNPGRVVWALCPSLVPCPSPAPCPYPTLTVSQCFVKVSIL